MRKRLLFIGMVVLVLSSAASAIVWDWFWGPTWGFTTPSTQMQTTYVTAGNIVANYGTGTTSNPNGGIVPRTQTSSVGTQSSYVSVRQYASVMGTGTAGSTVDAWTLQYQTRR
ncbi:MAG: hypothetical protein JW993_09900 [Sedimentisphaerales bacterium]|nr:hypothetical protein [Sedimentisphaerales bacterium]